MAWRPSADELARRDAVRAALLAEIRADRRIELPPFDPSASRPAELALLTAGLVANPFGASAGPWRYQFEGEDDLLHLIVTRLDGAELSPEEGREVAAFVLAGLAPALIWLKPGRLSQHFYVGHDDLLACEG